MLREARRNFRRGRKAGKRGREMPVGEKRKSPQRGRSRTEHAFPSPAPPVRIAGDVPLERARTEGRGGPCPPRRGGKRKPRQGRDRTEEKAGRARLGEDEKECPVRGGTGAAFPSSPPRLCGTGARMWLVRRGPRPSREVTLSCPRGSQRISGHDYATPFFAHQGCAEKQRWENRQNSHESARDQAGLVRR